MGVDRVEVEVLACRVVVGQLVLLAIGRLHVEEPRLQRLSKRAAESFGSALELRAHVQAERRDHPTRVRRDARQRNAIAVVRRIQAQPRYREPSRLAHGPGHIAQQMKPVAAAASVAGERARGQREAVVFSLDAELPARACGRQPGTDLRAAFVGRDDRGVRALQHLPAQHAGIDQAFAASDCVGLLDGHAHRQQAHRQAAVGIRKVLPPIVVGDMQDIGRQPQACAQVLFMRPLDRLARALGQPVAGQPVQRQGATAVGIEVAKFAVQAQAAARDHARGQRRIAVGCDVPVVGHRELDAAAVVGVDGGRQPARSAGVGQGETQRRQREDRHAQKAQHRAFGKTLVGFQVELDAVGAQQPGRRCLGLVARAARVLGVRRARSRAVQEVDPVGPSARADHRELELGAQEITFEALHPQLQFRAGVACAVTAHAHLPFRAGEVLRAVVGEPIGANHEAAAAELGVAFGHRFQVDLAADALRSHEGGQCERRGAAGRRLQARAGLKDLGRRARGRGTLLPQSRATAGEQARRQGQRCDAHREQGRRDRRRRRVRRIDYP